MGRSPLLYFRLPSISILRIAVISLCKLFWISIAGIKNIRTSLYSSSLNGQANFEIIESNKQLPSANFAPLSTYYNCLALATSLTIRFISNNKS